MKNKLTSILASTKKSNFLSKVKKNNVKNSLIVINE